MHRISTEKLNVQKLPSEMFGSNTVPFGIVSKLEVIGPNKIFSPVNWGCHNVGLIQIHQNLI